MAHRDDFASDNVAGAMPEAMESLVAANTGFAAGYGTDHVSARAADLIRELLDADAEVRFVASGTAANALSLAALAQPHEAVLCHEHAHIATDETGAPSFFGGGMGIVGLPGAAGRIDAAALVARLARPDSAHSQSPAVLSLTNATEYGTLYPEAALEALVGAAKAAGGLEGPSRRRSPHRQRHRRRPLPAASPGAARLRHRGAGRNQGRPCAYALGSHRALRQDRSPAASTPA